jgi:hypothetical protein
VVAVGDPPVVRAPFNVPARTWTRLPDSGFEVQHDGPGVQAIDASPRTVLVRRLGPEVSDRATAFGSRVSVSAQAVSAGPGCGPSCDYCESMDRVFALAHLFEDEGDTRTADVLFRVAERVGQRNPAGQRMKSAVLGKPPAERG